MEEDKKKPITVFGIPLREALTIGSMFVSIGIVAGTSHVSIANNRSSITDVRRTVIESKRESKEHVNESEKRLNGRIDRMEKRLDVKLDRILRKLDK